MSYKVNIIAYGWWTRDTSVSQFGQQKFWAVAIDLSLYTSILHTPTINL